MGATLLSLLLLCTQAAPAQQAAEIAITGVTVIDVEAGAHLPGQTVLIRGESIAALGPAAEVEIAEPARRIDGAGLFLIPGLVNSHVHTIAGDTEGRLQLAHGVTLVRDMGGNTAGMTQLRDRRRSGERLGPEMIVTGAIVDGRPPTWPFSEACSTPEEGRQAVRKLATAGVDQIKLYSGLAPEVYEAAIAEAATQRLLPVGHVPRQVRLEAAVEAGQRTIEHLSGFDELVGRLAGRDWGESGGRFSGWDDFPDLDRELLGPALRAMRERGTVVCPTLVVLQGIARTADPKAGEDPRMRYVPPYLVNFWSSGRSGLQAERVAAALPSIRAMVSELHRAGVTLLAGTDLANPYVFAGFSLHEELENLVAVGLSPAEALRSATLHPARTFGLEDRIGSVAAGKAANLVLLRADPLEDIRHAREIEAVLLRGRLFDRDTLDGLLE